MTDTIPKKKAVRKKVTKETDLIEVEAIRGIYNAKPGERVMLERVNARKLQDVGAVKVVI